MWLQPELGINSIPLNYPSNSLCIRKSWLQVLFFKKVYPLRNGWPQLLLWNKETLHPEKNCRLWLNAVNFKKNFFRNNYFGSQPFLMSCNFTRIFVQLLQYVISELATTLSYSWFLGWLLIAQTQYQNMVEGWEEIPR